MLKLRLNAATVAASTFAAVLLISACGGDDSEDEDICKTTILAGTSPTTGALTLTGTFYSNETVILQYVDNGATKQVSGTPATDRTSFTLTGLPSGERSLSIIISCDAGRENNGSKTFTVK